MSSILVAHSNPDYAKKIAAVLHSGGFHVSGVCTAGSQVIEFTNRHYQGGVVVCSEKLKDMPAGNLPRMSGSGYDFIFIRKAPESNPSDTVPCISLIQPMSRVELISTVNMLLNIADFTSLSVKKTIASGNLDEKKTIESAKNLLISRNHFTESQAHRFIQKKSMDTGKKMIETALIILNS